MYPEYSNLKDYPWNGIYLTHREHFIAHQLLHKTFKGSSQSRAFYHMSNVVSKNTSKSYLIARETHIAAVKLATQNPERNAKISKALKGKPFTDKHRNAFIGHTVTQATRMKLRLANIGKKATEATRTKMSLSLLGKNKGLKSEETKSKVSETKRLQKLRWFTNGTEYKLCAKAPDSTWTLGGKKGTYWFNNGVDTKLFFTAPDETWKKGKLPRPQL